MSMSTYVYGLKAPTERYLAFKAIRENCRIAGIDEPIEVSRLFDEQGGIDDSGERIELSEDIVKPYQAEMQDGYEVDVTNLPPEVTKIRFVNSY